MIERSVAHLSAQDFPKAEGTPTDAFRNLLVAVVGHDFRNQLQIILSTFSWLSRQVRDGQERQYLELGKSAAAQLANQFDQFIDALRVCEEGRTPAISRIKVETILAALHRDNIRLAEAKHIAFKVMPSKLAVKSDPLLLESILRNLTRNAFKYTLPGGRVLVICRRRSGRVRVEVHDTGAGIPQSEIRKIFNAFYRSEGADSAGLGLGLFIVRRAIVLLGHQLDVRSASGRGSCFSVIVEESD